MSWRLFLSCTFFFLASRSTSLRGGISVPRLGIESRLQGLKRQVLTTRPPGSSLSVLYPDSPSQLYRVFTFSPFPCDQQVGGQHLTPSSLVSLVTPNLPSAKLPTLFQKRCRGLALVLHPELAAEVREGSARGIPRAVPP